MTGRILQAIADTAIRILFRLDGFDKEGNRVR